jgi:Bax protein
MWTFWKRFFLISTFLLGLTAGGLGLYYHLVDREVEPVWNLPNSHVDFIHFILGYATTSNESIVNQRKRLLLLYQDFQKQKRIPLRQRHWLLDLAKKYKETNADFTQEVTWQNLIKKVDVIPNSLAIAQAIEESGWGRSRFAKEGNNFFGMWCVTENCGMTPGARPDGARHQVQIFSSPLQSVSEYMLALNSRVFYSEFRLVRAQLRRQSQLMSGLVLADTLDNYSTAGTEYTDRIVAIIKRYHLEFFDKRQGLEQDLLILKNEKRIGFY